MMNFLNRCCQIGHVLAAICWLQNFHPLNSRTHCSLVSLFEPGCSNQNNHWTCEIRFFADRPSLEGKLTTLSLRHPNPRSYWEWEFSASLRSATFSVSLQLSRSHVERSGFAFHSRRESRCRIYFLFPPEGRLVDVCQCNPKTRMGISGT